MAALQYDASLFSDAPSDKPGSPSSVDGPQPFNPGLFDDTADIPTAPAKTEKPSVLKSMMHGAGESAAPTAVGIAAGAATTAVTAPFIGPFAPIAGLAAGLGAGYAASKGQEKLLDDHPDAARALGQSPEQRQADEETNPIATRVGRVVPGLAAFRPTTEVFNLLKSGASETAKAAGKAALKTGAFNAAVTAGVTGGQQAYSGEFDPEDLLIQTGAGFLGQKPTRLAKILGAGDIGQTKVVNDDANLPPPAPLALPKPYDVPHTDPRVFTASETGLVSANDSNIRRAAMDAAPQGAQGDLFALGGEDTTQVSRAPVRPPQEEAPPPDQGGQAPIPMDGAGQPSLFTVAPTAGVAPEFGPKEVRQAIIGAAKPDTYGLKLAQKVHSYLKDGDTVAAADHVTKEAENLEFADVKPQTIEVRKGQLARAKDLVSAYTSKMTNAMAEEAVQRPRPEPANNISPAPVEPSVAAIREGNAARAPAEAQKAPPSDDQIAHANQVAEDGRRSAILKHVLDDPETISPAKRFAALLKRQNLDPAPRGYEKEEIVNHLVRKGRIEDAKTAFDGLTESGHPPDKSGTADLEALIPERSEPKPAAKPAAPAKVEPEFKLESRTLDDQQKIDDAAARRTAKVERKDAAAEAAKPAAQQGELFTPKGNPTKAAMTKRPALPKDEPTKAAKPTKEKSTNGKVVKDAPVRPKEAGDGRQAGKAPRAPNEEKEGLLDYAAVKKRADAAVSARSITPKQHGMVEAAIAAKSHTPEELSKEMDKMLSRGAEKAFEGEPRASKSFGKRESTVEKSSSPRTIEIIKSGGTLHDVLNHIAEASPDPKHRELAQTFSKMLAKGDVKLAEATPEEKAKRPGLKGAYYKRSNRIAVDTDLMSHEIDTTVLHEMIHAITETALDHNTPAAREFTALYNAYQKMAGVGRRYAHVGTDESYGFKDVHEFVSELYSNAKFRAVLKGIKEQGSPTNLLTRALNIIKRMLGLKTTDPLEHLLSTEARVYKIDTLKQSLRESATKRAEMREAAGVSEPVRARIASAPKEQREPLARLARITRTWATEGLSSVAMGNHLYDMAVNRGIKSARTLERVNAERTASANALIQPHLRLIEKARNLPQETLRDVNRLIQDSTAKWEFAFHPGYLREAVPDLTAPGGVKHVPSRKLGMQVKINPELNERYKALPPAARKVVTEAFRLSYDRLHDEKAAVLQHVSTSYDGLIADAQKMLAAEKDIKKRGVLAAEIKQYNTEKRQALSSYNSLLSIDPNRPYAPLTRNGDWVVTAKSDDYLKAEEAGDTETLRKLQSNPDHYFVDFAGSHNEGYKLADSVADRYGKVDQNVFIQKRNKFADKLYAGRDMTSAVQRLENLARQTDAPPSTRALINELKLKTLTQNSIRRSEMQRLNVAAGDLDMLRNVVSHGRSAAHFIGNLYHAEEVLDALQKVKKEVDYPGGKLDRTNRDDRQAVVNSIFARHEMSMNRPTDDDLLTMTASKLNSMTSLYMLAAKPMYYAQQLMQSWMYSHPMMAARYGYGKASGSMTRAYKTVAKLMADQPADSVSGKVLDQIDLSKLPDKYRGLADHLYQSGILDVGINSEMGGSNASEGLAATGERVMDKVRGLSRKVEAINRLTAGIAQYDLQMENPGKAPAQHDAGAYDAYLRDFDRLKDVQGHTFKPLTKEQFTAADNAMRLVRQSHGDLSMANSPSVLRNPVGRVVLQYKKFPLIMAGMMGREIEKSFFNGNLSPVERAVAKKTLAYLMGHTALMAGASGTVGYNVVKTIYDYVMSKADDEPRDMEADIRKAIGDKAVADLILKGAPTLASADLSGSLGMGNLLSIAPFAPAPTDRKSWEQFLMSASGPMLGGLIPRALDGVGYMQQGDYYKGLENLTPRGISDTIRAVREKTEGVTNKKGELLVDPANVPTMSSIWRAMGAQSVDQADRSTASDIKYNQEEYYKAKVLDVKRDYLKATDASEKAEARAAWVKLQDDRVAHGLKRQPLGDLLSTVRDKAKAERNTLGGMQYTRRNRAEVQELSDLFGLDDDADEDDNDPLLQDALQ